MSQSAALRLGVNVDHVATLRNARGDAEARLAQAPFSIDATYSTPRLNHNAIEPHADRKSVV